MRIVREQLEISDAVQRHTGAKDRRVGQCSEYSEAACPAKLDRVRLGSGDERTSRAAGNRALLAVDFAFLGEVLDRSDRVGDVHNAPLSVETLPEVFAEASAATVVDVCSLSASVT